MIERMEKDIFSLQNQDKEISKRIDGLRNDADKRDVKLANLSIDIENLKNVKADKSDLDMLQTTKADKTDLNMKVSRNDFDEAFADLSEQMNDLIVQVANQEKLANEMFRQNEEAMSNKLEQGDLAPFQINLENRLLSLKKLLEKTKHAEGDANVQESEYSALARKPMLGYKCVTCDKVTYPMPGDPVASIPMSGTMPHLATIRPFTTFDISGIRQAKSKYFCVQFFR